MPKTLLEQAALTESVDKKSGKILVDIITPGVGTAGYYSPEVCEAAAGLVAAGTQMFIDHPTDAEKLERPIRSVKDIAAVFTESARWDPTRGESGSLVAEAQVVPSWIETMDVIQGAIGVSIRASGEVAEGDVGGRRGKIVESVGEIHSVDFVTRAGRGGAFSLLESADPARVRQRAVSRGISEATVNDTREALQTVLRDEYGTGERTYVWVRDFDDTTVWFEVEDGDGSGIYGQTYEQADSGACALTGERAEVRVVTTYVSATRPDSTTDTTESKEIPMGKIHVEEAEHRTALEKAGRVDVLESENATKDARIKELEEAEAKRTREGRARSIVEARAKKADVAYSAREVNGFLYELPLTEAGELDEAAFTTAVDEDAAAKKAAVGAGTVRGHGSQIQEGGGAVTWDDIDEAAGLSKGA